MLVYACQNLLHFQLFFPLFLLFLLFLLVLVLLLLLLLVILVVVVAVVVGCYLLTVSCCLYNFTIFTQFITLPLSLTSEDSPFFHIRFFGCLFYLFYFLLIHNLRMTISVFWDRVCTALKLAAYLVIGFFVAVLFMCISYAWAFDFARVYF